MSLFTWILHSCQPPKRSADLTTPFEKSDSIETTTYGEGIEWWQKLADHSDYVSIKEFGTTDAGKPLHLVKLEAEVQRELIWDKKQGKLVVLINNGIHPGEPDGIDASMIFARELIESPEFKEKYNGLIFLVIPFYNVGGALNRNCCSRANQNGPPSYGFRGNARNLDLNRDFIKNDSRNAQSLSRLMREWDPDIYIETHVSNGADYPYTLTYLLSHTDKMMPSLKKLCIDNLEPFILNSMKEKGDECIPYVNVWNHPPDSGFPAFYDLPRYSTGYVNLFNTIGLLSETHMLKPFKNRVSSTFNYLNVLAEFASGYKEQIIDARNKASRELLESDSLELNWTTDFSRFEALTFKGYKAFYEESDVTGTEQLYYDHNQPWEKEIRYYRYLVAGEKIKVPHYYLVPGSWQNVIELLENNGVEMLLIETDSAFHVEEYKVEQFETSTKPYEGHYFHHNTSIMTSDKVVLVRRNEYYLVPTAQKARRLLVEVLEPESPDSYFNWNFFDEVLQQKEWFSAYVFDREASELLHNPEIKVKFDSIVRFNPELKENPTGQLV